MTDYEFVYDMIETRAGEYDVGQVVEIWTFDLKTMQLKWEREVVITGTSWVTGRVVQDVDSGEVGLLRVETDWERRYTPRM